MTTRAAAIGQTPQIQPASGEEDPLQLPPRPAPPVRRRWPVVAALSLGLLVALVGGLLFFADGSSPRNTFLSFATTTSISDASPRAITPTSSVADASELRPSRRGPAASAPAESTMPTPKAAPSSPKLLVELEALPVAEEHARGFYPTAFGFWADADGDGCDTRQQVLIDEATGPVTRNGRCRILSGQWRSPYDGVTVTDPADMAVDHVVSFREAWESGAWKWSDAQRHAYMNDLANSFALVAVTRDINRAKADQDPSAWLPPQADYVCGYLEAWVDTKTAWRLTVDPAEREAIAVRALSCN